MIFNSKLRLISLIVILSIFSSCNDNEGPTLPNTPGNSLSGAYIYYYSPQTGSDYAYYDAARDSVTDFVFTSNNPGKHLNINPGEMKMDPNRKLYLTTMGIPNQNGTIYKIDPVDNTLLDSLRFGTNPNGFAFNNTRIIVTNTNSDILSVLDIDLNLLSDTVNVGMDGNRVLYGYSRYTVTRHSNIAEPSIAMVDESGFLVTKLFFPGVPDAAIYNVNGIFVSLNTGKKVYRVDPELNSVTDSFNIATVYNSVDHLVFKTQNSFFAVAGNKEIWLATANSGTFIFTKIFQAANDVNIRSIAYEPNANEVYFASESFSGGNTLYIIHGDDGSVKKVKALAGNGSKSIVFRYF